MTYIKFCGITNREDAHAAIEAGADALGFIGIKESPRFISALDFQRIRDVLPARFPVIVVVKRAADAQKYHPEIVQYYESSDLPDDLPDSTKKLRVFRIHDAEDVDAARGFDGGPAIVLDAFHAALLGGSGTTFDWKMLSGANVHFARPFLLAGGLNHTNVAEAISIAQPYAVDVSSGVEEPKMPGKKHHELLKKFVASVRSVTEKPQAEFLS